MLSFEDFKKVELVVAKILEVKEHPDADRLYVLKVSLGEEERQLVAGIRQFYTPEQLVGRQVILVANLQPATIRGEESNGMLLAVGDDRGISIISPDREVAPGSAVH
ncbi:MAG: methionine--tRNA ligase subunit beta [Candidatus Omnitrophica bacterium]|nr:methionine--tRNA ligase subunit beta [Candidatus Omnitrophota bacterium]